MAACCFTCLFQSFVQLSMIDLRALLCKLHRDGASLRRNTIGRIFLLSLIIFDRPGRWVACRSFPITVPSNFARLILLNSISFFSQFPLSLFPFAVRQAESLLVHSKLICPLRYIYFPFSLSLFCDIKKEIRLHIDQ